MNKYAEILNSIIDLSGYAEAGQFAVITVAMQNEPKNAKWPLAYAAFYAQQGSFDSAIKYIDKALSLSGVEGKAWHMAGFIRLDQRKEKKAIEAFNEGIKFEDFPDDGWMPLVDYLLKKKKGKDAIDFLKKVQKKQPDNPEVFFKLGTCYGLQKKRDSQLGAFKKSIELNVTYYGRVKKELKDDPIVDEMLPDNTSIIDISVDATKKRVDESPQSHNAHAAYADSLMKEGRHSEAEVEVRKALSLKITSIGYSNRHILFSLV
ncbi:MAG: hypothetical protein ACXABF_09420 [Candidatus Thorarchaeota archaeon]